MKIKDMTLSQAYTRLGRHSYWALTHPGVDDPRNRGITKSLVNRITVLKAEK